MKEVYPSKFNLIIYSQGGNNIYTNQSDNSTGSKKHRLVSQDALSNAGNVPKGAKPVITIFYI